VQVVHPNGELSEQPWGTREFSILDPDRNAVTFFEAPSHRLRRLTAAAHPLGRLLTRQVAARGRPRPPAERVPSLPRPSQFVLAGRATGMP
jgi:hypothetical protein